MSRNPEKKKLPDSRIRPRKRSRPTDGPNLRGDGADFGSTKIGASPSAPSRYGVPAVCAFLLLAVALVFGQTLRHEFTGFDDNDYVYENPQVAGGFTAQGIGWAFTHSHSCNWHPLTWLSHMLDCQLYGLNHPGGHHLTNVLLHAASVILLFLVLRQMTSDLWPSAFAATLFAIHPLHVESVAWVAERKDVLSGLFFMLTLAAYVGYAGRPFSLLRYLLVTALFVLGLMAKPMLVTLPFVLLLLDYWPLGRLFPSAREPSARVGAGRRLPRVLLEKLPWLMLTAASCVVTQFAQQTALGVNEQLLLRSRIANAVVSCVAYLGQFFYPVGLAVFYPHPQNSLPFWKVVGSLLLLVGISLAVLAGRRKCPYLLVGWLWYLGMLVPVIGLVQVGEQAIADRYSYLPQIGLYIILVWGAERVSRHWSYRRWVGGATSALAVMSVAWCAWQQVSYWKDDETLWTHTLVCTSRNWVAHNNLGLTLAGRGRGDEAIAHYQKALEIKPNYANAHNNLGNALAGCGRVDEAIAHYQKALEIKPDFAEAHNNFGSVLAGRGRVDEAIAHYQKALEIKPNYANAHYNLGSALAGRGRVDEAIAHYQKALEIKPDFADAHNNLGSVLAGRGRVDEAIAHYQKALEIKPDFADAHNNLGSVLAGRGRVDEAIAHYQKALEIKPDFPDVHYNLGSALAGCGRVDEAIAHYQKALEIKPDFAEAHNNLGNALAGCGRVDEAIAHYQKALEIKPNYANAHNNLGNALAGCGRVNEAIAHYQKALEIKPNYANAHNNLGSVLAGCGRVDEAIAHYQKALEIKLDFAEAHNNLGNALAGCGRVDEAIAHYQKALEIKPDFADAHYNLAWIRATHPNPRFRDGVQAVALARRAVELSRDDVKALDTLAAAYAEAGRFVEAVQTAHKALELARQQKNPALIESLRAKIRLYEAGTPFHESQASPAKTSIRP